MRRAASEKRNVDEPVFRPRWFPTIRDLSVADESESPGGDADAEEL
jgi:hypothetical protein